VRRLILAGLLLFANNSIYCDIISLPEAIQIPPFSATMSGGPTAISVSFTQLNANGEKAGGVISIRKTGNVSAIVAGFASIVTGDQDVIVSLRTLDANDEPTETPFCVDSSTTMAVANTDDNRVLESRPFNSVCAVVEGDRLGVTIERPASAGDWSVGSLADNGWDGNASLFVSSIGASGYARQLGVPSVALRYDDGSLSIPIGVHLTGTIAASQSATNATNPNYVGNRFKINFAASSPGAWGWADQDGGTNMHLSDGSDVYLSTCTLIAASRATTGGNPHFCLWNTRVELSSGTYYWVFYRPTTGTSSVYYQNTVNPGYDGIDGGTMYDVRKSTASNPTAAGNWSVMDNQRMFMGVLIDKITTTEAGGPAATTAYPYAQ